MVGFNNFYRDTSLSISHRTGRVLPPVYYPKSLLLGPDACNAKCAHCLQGFGDDNLRKLHRYIPTAKALEVMQQSEARNIPKINFCLGEPFFNDWILALLPVIAKSPVLQLANIDTNCYWATSVEKAIHHMSYFKQLGFYPGTFEYRARKRDGINIFRLSASADKVHQASIPLKRVVNFITGFFMVFPQGHLTVTVCLSEDDKTSPPLQYLLSSSSLSIMPTATAETESDSHYTLTVNGTGKILINNSRIIRPRSDSFGPTAKSSLRIDDLASSVFLKKGLVLTGGGQFHLSARASHLLSPLGNSLKEAIATINDNVVLREALALGPSVPIARAGLTDYVATTIGQYNDLETFWGDLIVEQGSLIRQAYQTHPTLLTNDK